MERTAHRQLAPGPGSEPTLNLGPKTVSV